MILRRFITFYFNRYFHKNIEIYYLVVIRFFNRHLSLLQHQNQVLTDNFLLSIPKMPPDLSFFD